MGIPTYIAAGLLAVTLAGPVSPNASAEQEHTSRAAASVSGTTKTVKYVVHGSTAKQIRADLNRSGFLNGGERYDALTTWRLTWSWPGYGSANCNLSAAHVGYKIVVHIPRWKKPANYQRGLPAHWASYLKALKTHENGHVTRARQGAKRMERAIKNSTCSQADGAANQALNRLNTLENDYDIATDHGATQGAIFP